MYLIFRGDPVELERGESLSRQSVTIDGVLFRAGVPTDASEISAASKRKLVNNPHFEVVELAPSLEPNVAREATKEPAASQSEKRAAKRKAE